MNPQLNKTGLRVLKFWTTYAPDGAGGMKATDMVAYCPKGEASLTVSTDAVSRLAKVRPWVEGSEDVAAFLANERWNVIKPLYDAWKSGQELPATGTPLGAWSGITQEQADAMRAAGFRSVEEIAEMSDGQMQRIPLPGLRRIKETAQAFLASADKNAVSAELAKKDEEMAALRAELEEMKQLMIESLAKDEPKRRGRPPNKVEEAAEAA